MSWSDTPVLRLVDDMAHFARLDATNTVTEVVVVSNDDLIDPNTGQESEQVGIEWLWAFYGDDTIVWKQTSYNGSFRGRYAGIGYTYDPVLDVFVTPPDQEPEP